MGIVKVMGVPIVASSRLGFRLGVRACTEMQIQYVESMYVYAKGNPS